MISVFENEQLRRMAGSHVPACLSALSITKGAIPVLTAIKYGNLALAFFLELCALGALGYWGFHVGGGTLAKFALGIGVPVLTAVVWGLFIAPRATVQVPGPVNLSLRLLVFGLATAGLAAAGRPTWAWVFGVVVVVNFALVRVLGSDVNIA